MCGLHNVSVCQCPYCGKQMTPGRYLILAPWNLECGVAWQGLLLLLLVSCISTVVSAQFSICLSKTFQWRNLCAVVSRLNAVTVLGVFNVDTDFPIWWSASVCVLSLTIPLPLHPVLVSILCTLVSAIGNRMFPANNFGGYVTVKKKLQTNSTFY
jgi:hypothetical protein